MRAAEFLGLAAALITFAEGPAPGQDRDPVETPMPTRWLNDLPPDRPVPPDKEVTRPGQRQGRDWTTGISVTGRVSNRVQNRLPSRLRNRLDHGVEPVTDVLTPFRTAQDQVRSGPR